MAEELTPLDPSIDNPLPQTAEVDEQALQLLWEKGRQAWKDVPSASKWVESLRGNPSSNVS